MDTARMETVCCNELVCNFLIPALCGSGTEGFLTCGFLTLLHSGLNMVFPGWATCPALAPCRSDCSNFLSLRCRHRCCDALCATAVCWWEEEQGLLLLVMAGRPRWLCSREMWWATALIEVQEDLQVWVAAAMVAREMCDKKVIKKKFSPCYWLQKKNLHENELMCRSGDKPVVFREWRKGNVTERDLWVPSNLRCSMILWYLCNMFVVWWLLQLCGWAEVTLCVHNVGGSPCLEDSNPNDNNPECISWVLEDCKDWRRQQCSV